MDNRDLTSTLEHMSTKDLTIVSGLIQSLLKERREDEESSKQIARRNKSVADALRKRQLEAQGSQLFDKIMNGSIVKVDGVRDRRYLYRLVVSINTQTREFTGRQCAFKKNGDIVYGTQFPTHMGNKIREIVEIST